MTERGLFEREHEVLAALRRHVCDRASAEAEAEQRFHSSRRTIAEEFHAARDALAVRFKSEKHTVEKEFRESQRSLKASFESDQARAEKELAEIQQEITAQFRSDSDAAEAELRETRWMAATVHETASKEAERQLHEVRWHVGEDAQRRQVIWQEAVALLLEWRQSRRLVSAAALPEVPPAPDRENNDGALGEVLVRLDTASTTLQSRLNELKQLVVARFFKGRRLVWAFFALGLLAIYPLSSVAGWLGGLALSASGTALLGGALAAGLYLFAKAKVARIVDLLSRARCEAEALARLGLEEAQARCQHRLAELTEQRDQEVRQAEALYPQKIKAANENRDQRLEQALETYPRRFAEIKQRRDAGLAQADERYRRRADELTSRDEDDRLRASERHRLGFEESQTHYDNAWQSIAEAWRRGLTQTRAATTALQESSRALFPDWARLADDDWQPVACFPPAIRIGDMHLGLEQIPEGVATNPRLKGIGPSQFALPALLPFPNGCSLLFTAKGEGRAAAVETLQALMLRFLTSLPPGKVRFTLCDPVGLGQNFAAFMRLGDFDEAVVSSRIWTEREQIEQRLADLTTHMENVIQKYLRNEFETIEHYNAVAGEVAEPYRFLVVADFPANFSEAAAGRLLKIADRGPRCGVYPLILVDPTLPSPHGFKLQDLSAPCVSLHWKNGRFVCKESGFEEFPLVLDSPPPAECFIRILRNVGEAAQRGERVEVPFDWVAPPEDQWWTGDSRQELSVPLGRVGATRLQVLKLGQGTSQHVLVAGKTGSGKSTLLHVLITNLALRYRPEQVELYLVDFKKGVEFKAYANHKLPHARVIAVESDREFGLSVLERLDEEIGRRGEEFRRLGVQDLAAYRTAKGGACLARILLVVDEFQEFFVEDDRLAQDAALLLDRLVRQGRAFGIHVLLGSQTISGAYSLSRSTISQMAVRIALASSETDAHLILGEDNTTAALLSRPGEAIYNDANGLVEGNSLFQTAWLSDDGREHYLRRIGDLARQRGYAAPGPQVVFEGNVAADVGGNPLLDRLLKSDRWPSGPLAFQAWLGEAVAIKDPTAAVFQPQSGSNLLIVGQQGEAALAMLAAALVSLATQHAPESDENGSAGARFTVIDGGPADGFAKRCFDRLAAGVPHPVKVAGGRDLSGVFDELAAEVERRHAADQAEVPVLYLIVYDLARLRELRRAEDDFFSSGAGRAPASPADQLALIVREGPSVGVHTLVWCDSVNNLNRAIDRAGLREFDTEVLFQMSADDSNRMIDGPQASKLGLHRALLYSEAQGRLEKFRPYALPSNDWLTWAEARLRAKTSLAATLPDAATESGSPRGSE